MATRWSSQRRGEERKRGRGRAEAREGGTAERERTRKRLKKEQKTEGGKESGDGDRCTLLAKTVYRDIKGKR